LKGRVQTDPDRFYRLIWIPDLQSDIVPLFRKGPGRERVEHTDYIRYGYGHSQSYLIAELLKG